MNKLNDAEKADLRDKGDALHAQIKDIESTLAGLGKSDPLRPAYEKQLSEGRATYAHGTGEAAAKGVRWRPL